MKSNTTVLRPNIVSVLIFFLLSVTIAAVIYVGHESSRQPAVRPTSAIVEIPSVMTTVLERKDPAPSTHVTVTPQTSAPPRSSNDNSVPDLIKGEIAQSPKLIDPVLSRRMESEPDGDRDTHGPRGDHPDQAFEFRQLQLRDEKGDIAPDGIEKARRHVNEMVAYQRSKARADGQKYTGAVAGLAASPWTPLGPGNIGGRIRTIVFSPTNPNTMWIGSVGGGIWKSVDAGGNWAPVDDFMANIAVSTMIVDPLNPNTMYAGTGESFAAGLSGGNEGLPTPDGLRGAGVFKSTDGGTTWTRLASTDPTTACVTPGPTCPWSYVNRLAISPDATTILAATRVGLRRSTDGGATWNALPFGGQNYMDVDFDPSNSNNAVAGGLGIISYTTNGGANWSFSQYSTDGGTTFTAVISGRVEIAYAPSSPNIVYASVNQSTGTAPNQTQGDVFKSTDGGQKFIRVNAASSGNSLLGGQGGYDNIIWVNPLDPNFIVVGGVFAYRSTDGGVNWTPIALVANGPPMHSDHHMIVADPGFNNTTNKRVFFSNDGGIFRADDISTVSDAGGWSSLNNKLSITQFYGAATNSAGVILGGAQDNGTLLFTGDAQAWTKPFGGDGGVTAADPVNNNYLYGEYINLGFVRSTDAGGTFTYIYCPTVTYDSNGQPVPCTVPGGIADAFNGANFIAPIKLDPNEPNRMLAGGLSLWRSNDIKAPGTPSWTAIKAPVSDGLVPPSFVPISSIAISANNPDFIVVGDNNGGIYLTFDGTAVPDGSNNVPLWSTISKVGMAPSVATPARYVTRIVIDESRSPNWVYATYGGFSSDNVYVTKDLGGTWTKAVGAGSATLPSVPVRSMVLNPVRPDLLYVGTEVGIFASEDAGASWQVPQFGPANVSVDDLFWKGGSLVAATHGRGLFATGVPVFITNGGSGAGGSGFACKPSGSQNWYDPESWVDGRIPTSSDDVALGCPMKITSPVGVRNLLVNSRLLLNSDLGTAQGLSNNAAIERDISLPGKGTINAGTFVNSGGVDIGSVSAIGAVINGGSMNVIDNLNSGDLQNAGTLTVTNVTVGGSFDNSGSMTGNVLSFSGPTHTLQGPAAPKFNNMVVQNGQTVTFLSDMTFDIGSFQSNGNMDFNGRTLSFLGNSYFNSGSASASGALKLAPTSGTVALGGNAPAVNVVSGLVSFQGAGTFNGLFTVGPGTNFRLDAAAVTLRGNATIDGTVTRETTFGGNNINFFGTTFTNNGGVTADAVKFNPSGPTPLAQNIAGPGVWAGDLITIGNASVAAPSTVTLQNDVTFASKEIQVGYSFNLNGHDLTYTGVGNQFGIAVTNAGLIAGPGTFKVQPASGTPILRSSTSAATWAGDLKFSGGSTRVDLNSAIFLVTGKLTVDSGATLRIGSGFSPFDARNDVLNNGTINVFGGVGPYMYFRGGSFANNGSIDSLGVYFWPLTAQSMSISGGGAWTGAGTLYFDALSTTSFTSDVTYGSGSLITNGPLNGVDPSVFSVPCNVSWTGPGEITGKIRRTNLAACPGAAVKYGNAFTTIAFTSDTPPTDVLVSVEASPLVPAGFPGAVHRLYTITPTGGSGYTATLRLHYLDSELNGNDENTLELYRFDGTLWTKQGVSNRDTTNNWVEYSGVTQFSPWTLAGPQAPTAADAVVSGRVRTLAGDGIGDAQLTLTGTDGTTRTAITNPYGYFTFEAIPAGTTYVVNIASKRYTFAAPSKVIAVTGDITDLDFIAAPLQ